MKSLPSGSAQACSEGQSCDLADIIRLHGAELENLSAEQKRVIRAILQCRTSALGGHAWCCERCGHLEVSYNSCRDRHCPRCQWREAQRWLRDREGELLPVPYFHLVFTVPHVLNRLFLREPRGCLGHLFAAVSQTLRDVALEPKNLGAQVGFIAVLHTWTQKLTYHAHVHCIVPGGGLDPDTMQWIPSHPKFFLPVRVLSTVFRAKLLQRLESVLAVDAIGSDPVANQWLLREAARRKWVVYSKRPFAGPQQVLRYLGRYTHRIALSNRRILGCSAGRVAFSYRDRADENKPKTLTLCAKEFLRRFLLHVVPRHFVRIRYYGFLAQSVKAELLGRCRAALCQTADPASSAQSFCEATELSDASAREWICPLCHSGSLLRIGRLRAEELKWILRGRSTML